MDDQRRLAQAWALFNAFANNLPPEIPEERVAEFHRILQALGDASGEDLSAFQIAEGELNKKITGVRMGTMRRPGVTYYSDKRYCDPTVMRRQIQAVLLYFESLQPPPERPKVGF